LLVTFLPSQVHHWLWWETWLAYVLLMLVSPVSFTTFNAQAYTIHVNVFINDMACIHPQNCLSICNSLPPTCSNHHVNQTRWQLNSFVVQKTQDTSAQDKAQAREENPLGTDPSLINRTLQTLVIAAVARRHLVSTSKGACNARIVLMRHHGLVGGRALVHEIVTIQARAVHKSPSHCVGVGAGGVQCIQSIACGGAILGAR